MLSLKSLVDRRGTDYSNFGNKIALRQRDHRDGKDSVRLKEKNQKEFILVIQVRNVNIDIYLQTNIYNDF